MPENEQAEEQTKKSSRCIKVGYIARSAFVRRERCGAKRDEQRDELAAVYIGRTHNWACMNSPS